MQKKLIIFDMDGILVDSEPYWNLAIRKGFRTVGLEMSDTMCEETMGARLNEVVDFRVEKHQIDRSKSTEIEKEIEDEINRLVETEAGILPGVLESIGWLKDEGYMLAIASSSPHRLINTVLDKLGCRDSFESVFSAQDDEMGKPHPSVYIRCAKQLGFLPEHCIVIEDSVNGMVAGKAAKMKVIVVPDPKMKQDAAWGLADIQLSTLLELSKEHIL